MKVLVVDDEMNILKEFIENIVDYGEIQCAMFRNDVESLISYAKNNDVDAAFLDVVMPNIGGIELAKMLVKINPKIKIVFITGYIQDEEKLKNLLGTNMVGFCYKPYTKEKLFECIEKINETICTERKIVAKTFGVFDLQVDGKSIQFNLSKSKEMLAYLVYRQGQLVSMSEMIAALWPDHDIEKSKLLYRNAKSRLDLLNRTEGGSVSMFNGISAGSTNAYRVTAGNQVTVKASTNNGYTEITFPEANVRFIAINDGVDSESSSDNDFTPFRNIINEWYAKDTSKKIKAVFKAKGMSGKPLCTRPPFGYVKDPTDKCHWVIDEEAADIVRKIFDLCVKGLGPKQIADTLTEQGVETPFAYFKRKGLSSTAKSLEFPDIWS